MGVKGRLALSTAVSVTLMVLALAAVSDIVFRSQLEGALIDAALIETIETFDALEAIQFDDDGFDGGEFDGGGFDDSGDLIGGVVIEEPLAESLLQPSIMAKLAARTDGGDAVVAVAIGWDSTILIPLDDEPVEGVITAGDGPAVPEWLLYELAFALPSEGLVALDDGRFVVEDLDGRDLLLWIDNSDTDAMLNRVQRLLMVAAPVLAALGALVAWWLGTRALRPIQRMTAEVDRIGAEDLSRRVPVPGSADEVGELARTMNHMLARVESSHDSQRRFVADASHELRSPVSILKHESELALAYPERFTVPELAALTNSESGRLGAMVDDLLVLAAEGVAGYTARNGDGAEYITDLDEVVLTEAARPRRVLIDTSAVSAGRVRGRRDQVQRAVTHLLDNAARHASTTVVVSVNSTEHGVEMVVADDGSGVDPGDRDRIFERFVRLDEARARDDGGAGLGLAVVKAIVEAGGARVNVADSPLGGAAFTVHWPPM